MSAAMLVALSLLSDLPPLSDASWLPGQFVAARQIELLRAHRLVLRDLRSVRGWSGGAYDCWLAEVDHALHYWWLVTEIHSSPFGFGADWNRGRLALLRAHIGRQDYYSRWHPALLPEPPPPPMQPATAATEND